MIGNATVWSRITWYILNRLVKLCVLWRQPHDVDLLGSRGNKTNTCEVPANESEVKTLLELAIASARVS